MRGLRLGHGRHYRLVLIAALGIALAVAGGASRYDEVAQMPVRIAALAVLAASLWPLETAPLVAGRKLIAGIAAIALLLLAQLVPLPPRLWAGLPGHAVHGQIAAASDAVGWRPLSLTPDLTRNALFALLPATAATIAALHLDLRGRLWLGWGIVAIAVASALLGLGQLGDDTALRLYAATSADAPVGLFANRNHQAALLACALPLIGAIAGRRAREGTSLEIAAGAAMAVAALLLLALVSTGSRMGLILAATGLVGAVCAWRGGGRWRRPRGWRARALLLGGGTVALLCVGFAAVQGGAIDRLLTTDVAGETRAAVLPVLIAAARAFLPWGAGFGSFAAVYPRFEPAALLSTIYMNEAHDEPLQLVIEGGLPALALLGLFLAWWGRAAWRIMRAPVSRRRAAGIAATFVTAMLMASSLVDYPLRTPLLGALFAVCLVEMMRASVSSERP